MPIIERAPQACFDKFRSHMAPVIEAVIGKNAPLRLQYLKDDEHRRTFEFANSDGVRLQTPKGSVFLTLANKLHVQKEDKKHWRLTTESYRYTLGPDAMAEPHIRWEYERTPRVSGRNDPDRPSRGKGLYCRHHVHFGEQRNMDLGGHELQLSKLHVPTGWVLMEEVLRFVVVELAVTAHNGQWNSVLRKSEQTFFTDFTGKR